MRRIFLLFIFYCAIVSADNDTVVLVDWLNPVSPMGVMSYQNNRNNVGEGICNGGNWWSTVNDLSLCAVVSPVQVQGALFNSLPSSIIASWTNGGCVVTYYLALPYTANRSARFLLGFTNGIEIFRSSSSCADNKDKLLNLRLNTNYGKAGTSAEDFNSNYPSSWQNRWASELCYRVIIWRTNVSPQLSLSGWQCGGIRNEETTDVYCDFAVSPTIEHGTVASSNLSGNTMSTDVIASCTGGSALVSATFVSGTFSGDEVFVSSGNVKSNLSICIDSSCSGGGKISQVNIAKDQSKTITIQSILGTTGEVTAGDYSMSSVLSLTYL